VRVSGAVTVSPATPARTRAWLALLALGCGTAAGTTGTGTGGPPSQDQAPVIRSFTATPTQLPEGGGAVTLSWDVSGATALTVDPGVGSVAPATTGSIGVQVLASTGFVLHATGPTGTVKVAVASVQVPAACDASGASAGTCYVYRQGRCLDYANVSDLDAASLPEFCTALTGTWSNSPCPTDGRLGTCDIPPAVPSTGLECSPGATVLERFYPPSYTVSSAAGACGSLPGATFTKG